MTTNGRRAETQPRTRQTTADPVTSRAMRMDGYDGVTVLSARHRKESIRKKQGRTRRRRLRLLLSWDFLLARARACSRLQLIADPATSPRAQQVAPVKAEGNRERRAMLDDLPPRSLWWPAYLHTP